MDYRPAASQSLVNRQGGGVILADHLKSLDWTERRAAFAGRLADEALTEVRERIRPLLGL